MQRDELHYEDFQHLSIVTRKRDRIRDEENRHERRIAKQLRQLNERPNVPNQHSNNKRCKGCHRLRE